MKAFFLIAALLGLAPVSQAKELPRRPLAAANVRFVFKNFDGDFQTVCTHRPLSPTSPFDFKIECFRGEKKFADYTAHIALSQYAREGETKLSIELLYWLTGTHLPAEVGSTTWIHLAERAPVNGISTSQTVEGGTAGLYLEITRAGLSAARTARR